MSTILSIYGYGAFKRFLLPAINDADYSLVLPDSMFGLGQDIELKLEVLSHEWKFVSHRGYELILADKSNGFGKVLKNGDIFSLSLNGSYVLSIVVKQTEDYFSVFEKYSLVGLKEPVTIGRNPGNHISYDYLNLISGNHARIVTNGSSCFYEDLSSANGSFINNRRVNGSIPLSFGDCIDIYGLRIVFLGNMLAINVAESGAKIASNVLKAVLPKASPLPSGGGEDLSQSFHRSPRHIAKIDTESIRIEEAPQPKDFDQPTMFMAIAPTLTMALPMIVGCAMMVYASNKSGMSSGLFMYIGLFTAVASALIGSIWAGINLNSAKKKHEEQEARRITKYKEYLGKKEAQIKEKYQHNFAAMQERYKSADVCCGYTVDNPSLWSRNAAQPDFLSLRLGIGDVLFQAPIEVPDEKFTLVDDELADMPRRIKTNYEMLHNAPVCVDLLEERLVGVVGGRQMRGAFDVVLGMVAQLVANISYTDVKFVFIYDEKKTAPGGMWNFAKWLPHVWNETHSFRYVASNREEASDVFFEISKKMRIIAENSENTQGIDSKTYVAHPYYVIILANPEFLEGELVSKYILHPEPMYGISTLILSEKPEELPNECEFIIENDENYRGMYRMTDDLEDRRPVAYDPVSAVLLDHLAESVANIEVSEVEAGGDIPNSLTFLDMYGVQKLSELNVMERWLKNRTYDTMKALVGQRGGGMPCYLDIHEKYHGPHGLVAGTTGSGKSETLQTYILSLALNFSPDDIGFFMIDYKGGGMGNLFTNLPHTIGQISNLSGNQIRRALVSIKSEKDRRQRIFNEYGVNNINSYTKLYKNNETKLPVPHMFIIIDEFAEMKRDEPDFIQELVSVSQVGRSLGIHLIMATQKPAGTVDDNIWSNSRFKLCLRVQDRQDSMDMLHRADAAYITQAGRCYMQVGNDELFELFQSGYSGAPYSEDAMDMKTDVAKLLSVDGVPALEGSRAKILRKQAKKKEWMETLLGILAQLLRVEGPALAHAIASLEDKQALMNHIFGVLAERKIDFPLSEYNEKALMTFLELAALNEADAEKIIAAADEKKRKLPEVAEITQLDAVVNYLKDMAVTNGYNHDFSLFLPLLSGEIYLSELPGVAQAGEANVFHNGQWPSHGKEFTYAVPMGLFDDPENQRQDTYILDIARAGNTALFGTIATGKSTFLQTYLCAMMQRYTPAEVNFYILDFSAKMLSCFEEAPHVGGVMYEEDQEKISKFFMMIRRMLDARKKELRGGSFEQYLNVHGRDSMPAVIIVIDNYSSFMSKSGISESTEDFLMQLSKEGVSYGIFLFVTAAGFGSNELSTRMADNFRTTISLEMNDITMYGEVLRKMKLEVFPESEVKGRGIAIIGESVLEFQTALSVRAEGDYERAELLKKLCLAMRSAWTGLRAKPIPEIPEKPLWGDFIQQQDVQEMFKTRNLLPFGYDALYADAYGVNFAKIHTFAISGGKRKGKTNALKALMVSAAQKGCSVVSVDYTGNCSPLAKSVGARDIADELGFYHFMAELKPEFEKRHVRRKELGKQGLEEQEIYEAMQEFRPICIFVDNLPEFIEKAYSVKTDPQIGAYDALLESIVDYGALHNVFWFFTENRREMGSVGSYRLYELLIRDKKGIHLGGSVDSSGMNFDNFNYREREQVLPAGRGFLPVDNEDTVREVVVPLVKAVGK
ncbi:MAG: FHA domain-containing protein [Lachnospiraceae bacterium]|nr:FHA domain-containing protein [Lachnospiraceae bacterium]